MQIYDPVVNGLKLPINEVKKPRANQLLAASLKEVKLLEDAIFDLFNHLSIATAEGDLLDKLGALVGAYRTGRNDSDFRDHIYFQIAINTADGQLEKVIQIVKILTNSTTVSVTPVYPAGLVINVDGNNLNSIVSNAIQRVVAAGVNVTLQGSNGNAPFGLVDGENKQHGLAGSKGLTDDGVADIDAGFLVDSLQDTELNSPILEAAVDNAETFNSVTITSTARIAVFKAPSLYTEVFNSRLDVVQAAGSVGDYEAEALAYVVIWEASKTALNLQNAEALARGLATSDNKTRYWTRLGLL